MNEANLEPHLSKGRRRTCALCCLLTADMINRPGSTDV